MANENPKFAETVRDMSPERRRELTRQSRKLEASVDHRVFNGAQELVSRVISNREEALEFLIALRPDEEGELTEMYRSKIDLRQFARNDQAMLRRKMGKEE